MMRLDLFSENDDVLLVGEGNFSFSVCLLKHELPIKVTATCFEKEPLYKQQRENIEYLASKKVPVFFNVDATRLHENPHICHKQFSKIIFNFPHVGGKMKIQLNRQLMKSFFESSSHIVGEKGKVLVSLCQGQGGTPADRPQRKWADSWQITEMAAHGDFILTNVEPFLREYFEQYNCIGYRSQDVRFNLQGALVHVFEKRKPSFTSIARQRSTLVPLTKNSTLLVPVIYSELWENNPLKNSDSAINFIMNLLIKDLAESVGELKFLSDEDIPIFVRDEGGVPCQENGSYSLRCDPVQIFGNILELFDGATLKDGMIFFPGIYFAPPTEDFSKARVGVKFLVWGKDCPSKLYKYVRQLAYTFRDHNLNCYLRAGEVSSKPPNQNTYLLNSVVEIVCKNPNTSVEFIAVLLYRLKYRGMNLEVGVVNGDCICRYFFELSSWKEMWTNGNKVSVEGKPTLKQALLYPSTYTFDITLKFQTATPFPEEKFHEALWLAAGRIIDDVQLINVYTSDEDWSSRCYRIAYRCLDAPLYRNRALDVHSKIVGPALALALNVIIS